MAYNINQDYKLWVLLHQTRDAIFKARENELRPIGILPMQAAVLFIVKAIKGPATPAEIARWLFREHHTVSGLLNRMEGQGLVRKIKGYNRKNMIKVELTKKGEKAYIRSRELKSVYKIMSCLSAGEKDNLKNNLAALRNNALREAEANKQKRALPFPEF